MYLVSETVEEAVYDISVERRLAHVRTTRKQKRLDLNPNSISGGSGKQSSSISASASGTATPAAVDVETAIDAANEAELRDVRLDHLLAKGAKGGEVVGKDDLWNCLFGRNKGKGIAIGDGVGLGLGQAGEEMGPVGRFLAGEAAGERVGLGMRWE